MKSKFRLQMIIGLLFVAITVSAISLSLAWYSANPGEVYMEGSSVNVSTAENNFKYGTDFELVGQVLLDGETGLISAANSYLGEDGINNQYVLLFELTNPSAAKVADPYISVCDTTVPTTSQKTYESSLDNDFTVKYVTYTEGSATCEISDEITSYIIIIFGQYDKSSEFIFSDISYLGTRFNLTIYVGEDQE